MYDVRLVDEWGWWTWENYGRLEVSVDGGYTYGTVCDDYFDDNAAK